MSRQTPTILAIDTPFGLLAAADAGDTLPRFDLVAYTGGVIRPYGWWDGVVVDLAGIEVASDMLPLRFGHRSEWGAGIGHTTEVVASNGKLTAKGVVSRDTLTAREVVTSARNGFPWQASIGADPLEVEYLREGVVTTVNGQQVSGPLDIVRRCRLKEISIVDLGADSNTEVTIAAQRGQEGQTMTVPVNTTAGDQGGQNNPTPAPAPTPTPVPVAQPVNAEAALAETRRIMAAETERVAAIRRVTAGRWSEVEAQAIREGWDADRTELHVLRASRPTLAPVVGSSQSGGLTTRVLEAALAQATRLPGHERSFDDATLQAAHSRFRGRLGLQELLLEAAWANGYTGRSFKGDHRGVLQAAFSTRDISGVLSNTANKFLLAGFMSVEQAWREVASIRPVTDFKTTTSYRLTGDEMYEKIAPDGEIPHGTMAELSYSNKADTYAKMLAITRQDQINDDLNALSTNPQRLGRGAGLKLNSVFWTTFLANSAFFTSGNANYITGATAGVTTESRLSIDGLTRAERTFLDQTDAGTPPQPLGVQPATLLVPTALKTTAWALVNSTEIRDTTASSKTPTGNPHAGKYKPVVSAYLGNSSYTGYSIAAWYLLADPMTMSSVEVVFLNGQETPTVETADADFNTLGVQMRGYHDFGVALQEYRAGVKAKGEA